MIAFLILLISFCAGPLFPAHAEITGIAAGSSVATLPDTRFLQEVSWQLPTKSPLTAVATLNGQVYVGSGEGLFQLVSNNLVKVPAVADRVSRLVPLANDLWAITAKGLLQMKDGIWRVIENGEFNDAARFNSDVVVASGNRLMTLRNEKLELLTTNQAPFAIRRLLPFNDSLYLQGGNRITFFDGTEIGGKDAYDSPADLGWDWGNLPSQNVRDALALDACLYLATDRGLGVLRGMSISSFRGADGLPFEDCTCLARGFTNDLWIGTSRGAIRKVGNDYHYFSGLRWVPGEQVNAIATSGSEVYIATDKGLGIISYHPMTLEDKAAFYEQHLKAWGQKRFGLVQKLEWDDGLQEYVREAGDNDGGYSSDYLSAQCYRYAVTKDPVARAEAVNTFKALVWLEQMTGIPGFPARSVWVKGERGHKSTGGSGGYPAEWHDVPGGVFEWKGDTSSDEICGHFYAISLFLELAAEGDEIPLAKRHLHRIASHLIDHHWQLIDVDGKPTRWGRWDPDYFLSDEGRFDRGLQCVELLSFMKTAEHYTGDAKFGRAYDDLTRFGYPGFTLRQRNVFPPENTSNFEDQLAFWCYWNLLRLAPDPILRSVYRRSFERSWEVVRIEQQPWLNFVYGVLTGNDCDLEPSVRHLREWPLDLAIWSYQNSHRADLRVPPGYTAIKAATRPFSPREREPMRWDGWTMQADGGTDGRDVVEPSSWLLAYWMGRYHHFIAPAKSRESIDIPVQVRRGSITGARPYSGPPRPRI
jgi:hypothetical protein